MNCLKCLKKPCSWLPKRYFFTIYSVIGLIIFYWIRVSVYLSLTQMTFPLNETKSGNTNESDNKYCPASKEYQEESSAKAEFYWNQFTQHLIIQGFYYGYIVANIPGGIMADTFGGKSVLAFGFLLATIASLLTPVSARISPYGFFLMRIFQGIGQGVVLPALSSMVAKWAPPNERATMTGFVQSGVMFGNASAFIVSGFIVSWSPTWAEIFYINGFLGVIWVIGWYFLCYSSPAQHPFVSDKEKNMIESLIAENSKKKPKRIPWKSILTSPAVFAAVMANYGHLWANFSMINELPTYMNKVLNFNIKKSGIFSATPHIAMSITAIGTGYLCDFLVKNKVMSITLNRKIFIFLSNSLPVPFLLAASYSGCDKVWAVILFSTMMFFKGLAYATLKAQPVDLSPHYAGILMGILNGTGAISGFISPLIVPWFISGDGSIQEWRRFFFLTGFIMVTSTFPFFCCGSGKVQTWNFEKNEEEETSTGPERTSTEDTQKV